MCLSLCMRLKREGPTYLGISWVRLLRIQSFLVTFYCCAQKYQCKRTGWGTSPLHLVVTLNLVQQWGQVWRGGYIMCGGLILPAGSTWENLVCPSYAAQEWTNTYMSTHSMKEINVV